MSETLQDVAIGRVCVFELAERLFALDVTSLAEIAVVDQVTSVPLAPRHVVGVTNLRGTMLPIVDPALALQLRADRVESGTTLVLKTDTGLVGLVVDRVQGLVEVREASPPGERLRAELGDIATGSFRSGDSQITLLDAVRLVEPMQILVPQ